MKKLTKTGEIFFGIMLLIGIILGAADCESLLLFAIIKGVAVAFILVAGNLLTNNIK